jgi:probable rRNA maturation factor
MIEFNYETDFELENEEVYISWLSNIISSHQKTTGAISFIFSDDDYLHQINVEYLNHDTLTDIISFDYTEEDVISGDVFISIERVKENAIDFKVDFHTELLRVLSHGILHFLGFKDKSDDDARLMRIKEDESIQLFHVKQL